MDLWARFLLVIYYEFFIACFAGIQRSGFIEQNMTLRQRISHSVAWIFTVIMFLFPVIILVIIRKEKVKRNNLRSNRVTEAEKEEIENKEQSKL